MQRRGIVSDAPPLHCAVIGCGSGFAADIVGQRVDILGKGGATLGRDGACGAGHTSLEAFAHGDVSRFLQFVDLHAEVAGRGPRPLAQVDEVGTLDRD